MNEVDKSLLSKISGLEAVPPGAYNLRVNGSSAGRADSENVSIRPKDDGTGLDIHVRPGTRDKLHIPVIVSQAGLVDVVQNDFFIGEGADVSIVAGCGIHNDSHAQMRHDGLHIFHIDRNARVFYEEKHYGEGLGSGENVLNPVTDIFMEAGAYMEMETVQIEGVDSTRRITRAVLGEGATLIVREKLMTHDSQTAETAFEVDLNGDDSSANVISRSVAKDRSSQIFLSRINGNSRCMGHSECDAIIMDNASVKAIPEITANHGEASLIHEAAIGKIAGEQLIKLMTLGLSQEEAESQIVNGFLK
ncbi:ABC transporter permease [Deltaproteobacteria bacterium Smac51]|nr:ABC transporter permease [Deltaproteobacteria bacterium Smac51]